MPLCGSAGAPAAASQSAQRSDPCQRDLSVWPFNASVDSEASISPAHRISCSHCRSALSRRSELVTQRWCLSREIFAQPAVVLVLAHSARARTSTTAVIVGARDPPVQRHLLRHLADAVRRRASAYVRSRIWRMRPLRKSRVRPGGRASDGAAADSPVDA